jgi:RNA polymerase sigma-70 factor (ECF subfamily)
MSDDAKARFADFYRANYSLILATCMRRLNERAAAEDATSEVFRVAWMRFQDGTEISVPWLYGVARNVVGNAYRGRARNAAIESAAIDALRSEDDPWSDDAQEVRAAMRRLRPTDRELLFMTYWEDLSGAEVAQILRCKVSAVWVRLNRARSALRRELTEARSEVRQNG